MENVAQETKKSISGAIKVDEKEIRDHLDGLVRQSVEDTLNALLKRGSGCHLPRRTLSADAGSSGHTGGHLSAQTAHQGWRSRVESDAASQSAL